jgi:hypothetical protein
MKALTIAQPYADMIAKHEKLIENRTWATSYRGPLAIHAGKSRSWLEEDDEKERQGMVFGAIVAIADLRDCTRLEDLPLDLRTSKHANGPWCWVLRDVRPLSMPVFCRGAQGLWEWRR